MPASKPRRQPQRSCVACRQTTDKRALIRLVASPDGHVRLDATGRLPGRGAYLCSRRSCWERALAGAGPLGRALRRPVPPEDREVLLAQAPAPETDTQPSTTTSTPLRGGSEK